MKVNVDVGYIKELKLKKLKILQSAGFIKNCVKKKMLK